LDIEKNVLTLYHIIIREFPNSKSIVQGRSVYSVTRIKRSRTPALCSGGKVHISRLKALIAT